MRNQKATAEQRSAGGAGQQADVLAAIPVPAIRVDGDGMVIASNAPAAALLGLERRPPIAFDMLVGDHEEGGRMIAEMATGTVEGRPLRLRRAEGQEPWVLVTAGPPGEDGSRLVVLDPVDCLKVREEALAKACEQAREAAQAKMRFFAAASHDLRQPLQALALFVSVLDNQLPQQGQQRVILHSIKTSLKSMEQMFETLLDMSRIDAGVLKAEPVDFMVGDLLEEMENEFTSQAEAAGLRLRVVPSSQAIHSDRAMLGRIVRNFLSNAVRYTSRGKILLGCRRRGGHLRIEVWDTGCGIPENKRAAIFGEFYRGAGERAKGTGLGLAIVERLAGLLQHGLHVHSVEGRGSMFAVEVPLAEPPAFALEVDDREEAAAEGEDLAGATVVVVDDDPGIREGVRLLVRDWGGRAVVAGTPEEAVAALAQQHLQPDVVIADLMLGGVDAIHVIRREMGIQAPGFVLTGDTRQTQANGFRVLHKPLNPARLRTLLAETLRR